MPGLFLGPAKPLSQELWPPVASAWRESQLLRLTTIHSTGADVRCFSHADGAASERQSQASQVDEIDAEGLLELASIGRVDLHGLMAFAGRGLPTDIAFDELVPGNDAGVVLDDAILMHVHSSEASCRSA